MFLASKLVWLKVDWYLSRKILISSIVDERQNHQIGSLLQINYQNGSASLLFIKGSIILLQSAYLRGAFHQKATRGMIWQVDRERWDRGEVVACQALPVVVACQARPLVVACQAHPLVVGPRHFPPFHFHYKIVEMSWVEFDLLLLYALVLKRFIPVRNFVQN